jgi:translation initiation factor 1
MPKKKLYNSSAIIFSTDPDFKNSEQEGNEDFLTPSEQKLKIILDKKHRAGKVVTLIKGFFMREEEIGVLARQLKAFCGSGGSFSDNEIIIQGDHREKILQWLLQKGYSKSVKI